MTLTQFKTMLEGTGYPVAYEHFPETEVPTMPFVCYAVTGSNNFDADGIVYEKGKMLQVQLFTKTKNEVAEASLETVFENNRICWENTGEYNEDELCYRVIYEVQI